MNLGTGFRAWTSLLYAEPYARVQTGGHISNKYRVERGTRQGCPLSPLLFAIAIEPLASWARLESSYKGIKVAEIEHRIALYADDLLMFLADTAVDLPRAEKLLENFGRLSGLKVSWSKTCLFPMTTAGRAPESLQRLQWEPSCLQYLGVKIYHEKTDVLSGNISRAIRGLRSSVMFWNTLPLSVAGRIAIIKIIALPRLLYFFSTLPIWIPGAIFRELDSLMISFIWDKGRRRVALTTMQRTKLDGGLAVPDLEGYYLAAQMQWYTQWQAKAREHIRRQETETPTREQLHRSLLGLKRTRELVSPEFGVLQRCWSRWLKKSKTRNPYSPELSLEIMGSITHKRNRKGLQRWKEMGISKMGDLFKDNQLVPFGDLCEEFGIPAGDFLLHRAMIATVRSIWGQRETEPPLHRRLTYISTSPGTYKADRKSVV